MRVSASVMAHPDRREMVDELRDRLDRRVPVYWDPEGSRMPGNPDRVWRVAREAWRMYDPRADYHVLIQDDAIPCRDFLAGMEQAIPHTPDGSLVCPYLGMGRNVPARWGEMARRADAVGASWVRSYTLMWGVSIAAPTQCIPEMIAWCDRKAGMPDDMRVGRFFIHHHVDTFYTWPSLVDHRRCESLTKHRQVERVARRHHQGSALELDWEGDVVVDPNILRSRIMSMRSGPTTHRRRTPA